ncbi:MAG TPA: phosphotransferase [Rhodospirillaceae bacterium]|nr:phosphotransferase [Rhodospirillaceae bacterium]
MSDRATLMDAFLTRHGWPPQARRPLAGDASFRHYHRLADNGRRAVLMDAPPPQEDVRPFVLIARHLAALGLSTPALLAVDETAGLLLLEDFGDDTFTRLLDAGTAADDLYALAIDCVAALHRLGAAAIPAGLPAYDDQRLLTEALLLTDWYLPKVTGGRLADTAREDYAALWRELFPLARAMPDTLVLRDFHVDNLMRLPGRPGVAACGLLDFQDAVAGPLTYDLMSLLEDARRDLDPALVSAMRRRYLDAFPALDREAFDLSWTVLAAQRHAKVIGIFTRLEQRDGKPVYLRHIPRVWHLLEAALAHPRLGRLKAWLDRHLPAELRR